MVTRRRYRRRFRLRRLLRRIRRRPGGLLAVAAGIVLAVAVHASTGVPHAGSSAQTLTAGATSTGANVALGQRMAAARGWTGSQWSCLDWLWTRESGWSNTADNTHSGAYGIAQALGHGPTNQYPAGPANPPQSDPATQIDWGLGYIAATYGSPCAAWQHETADSWY
jgi:hypothetical protein